MQLLASTLLPLTLILILILDLNLILTQIQIQILIGNLIVFEVFLSMQFLALSTEDKIAYLQNLNMQALEEPNIKAQRVIYEKSLQHKETMMLYLRQDSDEQCKVEDATRCTTQQQKTFSIEDLQESDVEKEMKIISEVSVKLMDRRAFKLTPTLTPNLNPNPNWTGTFLRPSTYSWMRMQMEQWTLQNLSELLMWSSHLVFSTGILLPGSRRLLPITNNALSWLRLLVMHWRVRI